jgi:hypothetical protein
VFGAPDAGAASWGPWPMPTHCHAGDWVRAHLDNITWLAASTWRLVGTDVLESFGSRDAGSFLIVSLLLTYVCLLHAYVLYPRPFFVFPRRCVHLP